MPCPELWLGPPKQLTSSLCPLLPFMILPDISRKSNFIQSLQLFGLEGTIKFICVQPPCHGQVCHPLDQVAHLDQICSCVSFQCRDGLAWCTPALSLLCHGAVFGVHASWEGLLNLLQKLPPATRAPGCLSEHADNLPCPSEHQRECLSVCCHSPTGSWQRIIWGSRAQGHGLCLPLPPQWMGHL